MKFYIYILFIFLSFSLTLNAQNKSIDALISKYSDMDGFKAVVMNDPANVIMQNESGEEADLAKDLLKGIKIIKIVSYKPVAGKVSDNGKNFSSEIAKLSLGDGFTEIMSLNEGKSKIRSMIRKSGEKVSEFVMIVAGETESTIIWLNGEINLQNVGNIGKILQFRGNDKGTMKGRSK